MMSVAFTGCEKAEKIPTVEPAVTPVTVVKKERTHKPQAAVKPRDKELLTTTSGESTTTPDVMQQTGSPNALVSDRVEIKPFERVEIDKSLPELPPASLSSGTATTKQQISELPFDQSVSQMRAGFQGVKQSVQPGKFISGQELQKATGTLRACASRFVDESVDMPKSQREQMEGLIEDAISDLEEAANTKGGQNPGNVQNRIDRAENSLRQAENIIRLYKQQNK